MSILIEGMEMPKDDMKNIMIFADGRVFQFSGYGNPKPLGTAVPVPPHGRLIDADAFDEVICNQADLQNQAADYHYDNCDRGFIDGLIFTRSRIRNAPTIIQASEEVEI